MKKIIAMLLMATALLYGEGSISIGPAPVSSDNIEGVGEESRVDISYMSYSTDDFELTAVGIGGGSRKRSEGGSVFDVSFNLMALESDIDLTGFSYGANILLGQELGNSDSIIYVGPTLSMIAMEITSGTLVTNTFITMYGVTGGIQFKLNTAFGSISPWAFANYTSGTVSSDTSGYIGSTYIYYSSDADIDPIMTTQFGFDMYFDAIGSSLSTMMQSNEDGDMISLAYSFKF